MEYEWYMSSFNRANLIVSLTAKSGYVVECYYNDTDLLNTLALRHNVISSLVEDEAPLCITFTFQTEADWEGFCFEFLKQDRPNSKDDTE